MKKVAKKKIKAIEIKTPKIIMFFTEIKAEIVKIKHKIKGNL